MEPRNYFSALLRSWLIIILAGVIGGALAFAVSALQTNSYEARAAGIVAVENVESGSDLWQTSNATIALASSYAELATTPLVTEPVAEELGDLTPGQVASKVNASVPLDSVNITVTATDPDPERAARLANATVQSLEDAIEQVSPKVDENTPAVRLQITQQASAPSSPSGLSTPLLLGIGVVGGLGIGVIIALLRAPVQTPAPAGERAAARNAEATPARQG